MNGSGTHRIEVTLKGEFSDPEALSAAALLRSAGAGSVSRVRTSRIYELHGALTIAQVQRISRELLSDTVTQEFRLLPNPPPASNGGPLWRIELRLKATITDPVGDTIREAIGEMGLPLPESVRVLSVFRVESKCGKPQIEASVARSLANPVIHSFAVMASS
jgi:phosphoribosylformylglycinamidine (FGAM) synthase PurS component